MITKQVSLAAILLIATASQFARVSADDVQHQYYNDANGNTFRQTTETRNKLVTETQLEQRESIVYRPRVTTELRDTPQTTPIVVTEYHWTPVYRRSWNVFAPPYLTYEWLPQTHVETRTDIVKTACTRSEYVPEKVTQQVPVTKQSLVPEKIVTHSYVGRANVGANVAVQNSAPADQSGVPIGGISKMESDPPRGGTAWRPGVNTLQR